MYKVKEVANLLKVAPITVYKAIKEGSLPAYKAGKKSLRIRQEDLDNYIKR